MSDKNQLFWEMISVRREGVSKRKQKAIKVAYKQLTPEEHKNLLISKLVEEVEELHFASTPQKLTEELADIQQVLGDVMTINGIGEDAVEAARQVKFPDKGGFAKGTFVDTIELSEDDEWVKYYRERPDIFPE
ncbi:unnamed protein product, partial [Rotaria magnacalcarata]